jgi:hypothetical protein
MRHLFVFMCVLALGLVGCNQTRTFTYADEGSLCLNSNVDETLDVEVSFPTCLSSTCDHVLGTSCTVAVSEDEITITSNGAFESPVHGACSVDCRPLIASCSSDEPLAPGDYTLVHGEDSAELALPVNGLGLFEQGFFQCECRGPLGDYCEGSDCPTIDQAIAYAEQEGRENFDDPSCFAETGHCEEVPYVRSRSAPEETFWQFFDASGVLFAAEVSRSGSTTPFCDGRSHAISYGPVPDYSRCVPWDDFCR